jgi:hypothetical protein
MPQETKEVRHPHPGVGPRNEQAAGHVVDDIVRRTSVGAQAEKDRLAFEVAYRLGFETGVDVGRARAEREDQERDEALADAVKKYSRTRTYEELQILRYPTYTAEQLRLLRGRDRFPVGDRLCVHCDGRGYLPGGVT